MKPQTRVPIATSKKSAIRLSGSLVFLFQIRQWAPSYVTLHSPTVDSQNPNLSCCRHFVDELLLPVVAEQKIVLQQRENLVAEFVAVTAQLAMPSFIIRLMPKNLNVGRDFD